ncbi:COG1361 S-layer family protein [Halorubrum amylolyticum]|uniref:COG1361 S-layer family protein n=1 Tax=Halorubrum amylolyticum TaxID=2508724 RepID=UPI001F504769|nr:exo-alpha-sialidase [Halorubrum amylolyticum]
MRRTRVLAVIAAALLVTSGTVGFVAGAAPGGTAAPDGSAAALDGAAPTDPTARPQTGGLVRGSPDLSVTTTSPRVTPGRTNEVTLQVSNSGDMDLGTAQTRDIVTTARNVRVTAEADDNALDVETRTVAIGAVTESAPGETPIAVTVPEGVEEGTYELDVELEYSYTHKQSSGVTNDRERTVTREVKLEVTDDARFRIVNVTSDAQVGDGGTLEAEIENVGASAARDAVVSLESSSAGLRFGESTSDAARIGELDPGETTTLPYEVTFAPDAPVREYAVSGSVRFDTTDGVQRVDEGLAAGVTPLGEQAFTVSDIESDLRIGEDGAVSGTVTNDGPVEARSVVVRYAGDDPSLIPIERSTAVGSLGSGESTDFEIPMAVGGEAEAGLRSVDLAVGYRNDEGERRVDETLALDASVAPERDRFGVEVANRTIESGGTRTVDVAVTNNLDETATDVEARLFADDPLDAGDTDSGYVQSLDPGETATMTLELTTTGSATPGSTYPISLDFRYDDADGDSHLTDTYRVPIDVVEAEGGGLPLPLIVVVLLIVGTGGLVAYRRRQ